MNETEFNLYCDNVMFAIEEAADSSAEDIDCETSSGILTLTIEANGSKVIVSRQPTQAQIWIAAKSGGYYLNLIQNSWICTTTKESLGVLLHRVCFEQDGGEIIFDV